MDDVRQALEDEVDGHAVYLRCPKDRWAKPETVCFESAQTVQAQMLENKTGLIEKRPRVGGQLAERVAFQSDRKRRREVLREHEVGVEFGAGVVIGGAVRESNKTPDVNETS